MKQRSRTSLAIRHILPQSGKGGRTGAAGVNQRCHPTRGTAPVGFGAHVVGVHKGMGVDIDQPRTDDSAGHVAYASGLRRGDIGGDGRYFAVPNRHVGGLECLVRRPAGVNDPAALDEEVVLHQQSRFPSGGVESGRARRPVAGVSTVRHIPAKTRARG